MQASVIVWAGKKPSEPQWPDAAAQQSFTEQFWQAVDGGDKAFQDFSSKVNGQAGPQGDIESKMLKNLSDGKAADGGQRKGFRGDPNDPGPQDWSDWNVKTDADGNVTGFEEKNAKEKDTNGDGEVSNEERADWEKKKDEERKQNKEGAPGDNYKDPDWDDSPPDGKPDADYQRDCWRCKKGIEPQCQDGMPGPCDSHACDNGVECYEHAETFETVSLICHSCGPKETIVQFCENYGYFSDPSCGGQCKSGPCVSLDIDKKTGSIVPTMQTRERGSTQQCYGCMKVESIEITWVIIIVETPYSRFVLGQDKKSDGFKPSSVMALAKADTATGKIMNTAGEFKSAADFLGGFNIGFGPMGPASTGTIGMDQLSGLLSNSLSKGGSYGSNCFDDAIQEADKDAENKGNPTSAEINDPNKSPKVKDKPKQDTGTLSKEEIKKAEEAGTPEVSGPIVACGQEGKNKVLKIYDSAGRVVDTITQKMLKLNPGIINEKLALAQGLADKFLPGGGFNLWKYVEKFTGLPVQDIQEVTAKIAQIKANADEVISKIPAKKRKRVDETFVPNDPLYKVSDVKKKKNKSKAPVKIILGESLIFKGNDDKKVKTVDQYALDRIGFTPYTDPDSAWNVVDATKKNIVVAVIDSGLDLSHPDAPQYIWQNPLEVPDNSVDDDGNGLIDDVHGWNFLDENHDFTDVRGHGTFVAGIIAAKTNNGIGIAGINPGAVIMPIKVANDDGETDNFSIFRGINYAVDHGAKVINVSLGGRTISKLEQAAIDRAHAKGALVVVAAGNSNENMMVFGPSSSKNVLAVGEINFDGTRSTASNWGPNLGLVAPGEEIYSLCSKDNKHVLPSIRAFGYYTLNGTSFSTPMVAASASLIWAKNPDWTNQQVADTIVATATDMGDEGWDAMYGAGLLNAAKALRSSPDRALIAMFTNMRFNRDVRDKVVSVDLYGTVRGPFKEYSIELGKGKLARSFVTVAGPFTEARDYQFITRLIIQDVMRGSDAWIVRIRTVDNEGKEHFSTMPVELPK